MIEFKEGPRAHWVFRMAIIKNYGLRWRRDQIEWGAGSRGGHLSGIPVGKRRSDPVNFREQIGIYILYEDGFTPVYIGQAGSGNARLFGRLKLHRDGRLRDRWAYVSWFGFREVDRHGQLMLRQKPNARVGLSYTSALDEIEGVLIQALEPRLNKQGARWQQTAVEYIQSRPASEEVSLQTINAKLIELEDKISKASGKRKKY